MPFKSKTNVYLEAQIKKTLDQLVADINSPQEARHFLSTFLNEDEYLKFAKRVAVSYWLHKKRTYSNIKTNLKVSSATISKVQKTSDNEGTKIALKKIETDEWANVWSEKIKKYIK
jgi:uncharacterized protein YerC